jgi:formylglycine-generating enzyme required for sulfatase activity
MKKVKSLLNFLLLTTALTSPLILSQTAQAADYTNAIGMNFVEVKAGCFNMGRDPNFEDGSDNELPRHRVCIKKPFYLGKTEVTQSQWVAVMGSNPSKFKGRNNPVEQVSWDDAQNFIRRLNQKEGSNQYRLPTEAEWEYAARAGSSSTYHFGDDKGSLSQYAWFDGNSGNRTHPVAQKRPNQWGLYDMHGNVWEWVQDWYGENYYRNSVTNDPKGSESGRFRVFRGGSWSSSARDLRSARRGSNSPGNRGNVLGFRLVRQP